MVTFSLLFHQVHYSPAYCREALWLCARSCFKGKMQAITAGHPKDTSSTSSKTKQSLASTFTCAFPSAHLQLLRAGEGERQQLAAGSLQRSSGTEVLVPAGMYGSPFQRRLLSSV